MYHFIFPDDEYLRNPSLAGTAFPWHLALPSGTCFAFGFSWIKVFLFYSRVHFMRFPY